MLQLEDLLDKDDRGKLELLRLLEEAPELTELNRNIQDKLTLSNFLFNKTIEALELDFEKYGLETYFTIDRGEVQTTLLETGYATSDLLLALYIKNSLSFKILLAVFNETFKSANTFAIDEYLSYTRVYSRFQQLKKLFGDFAIDITKENHFKGDEATLRGIMTRIFSFATAGDFSHYPPAISHKTDGIIGSLIEGGLKIPRNNQIKLGHYLAVSLTRQSLGHELAPTDPNKAKVIQRLKDIYEREYQIINSLAINEALKAEVLAFLYTHGGLNQQKMLRQHLGKRIDRLGKRFLQEFRSYFDLYDDQIEATLWPELTRLHFELFYFPLNTFYAFNRFDVSFFEESYSEYFHFCQNYFSDQKFIKEEGFQPYQAYVFFKYLMILVSNVAIDAIMPPLKICIDFSFGQEYNEFIQKNLNFFVSFNLDVEYMLDSETDLVITDLNFEYSEFDVETVIWLEPPRPTDWGNLGNRLLDIRNQKRGK